MTPSTVSGFSISIGDTAGGLWLSFPPETASRVDRADRRELKDESRRQKAETDVVEPLKILR
jgi:hypothetical protein